MVTIKLSYVFIVGLIILAILIESLFFRDLYHSINTQKNEISSIQSQIIQIQNDIKEIQIKTGIKTLCSFEPEVTTITIHH